MLTRTLERQTHTDEIQARDERIVVEVSAAQKSIGHIGQLSQQAESLLLNDGKGRLWSQ